MLSHSNQHSRIKILIITCMSKKIKRKGQQTYRRRIVFYLQLTCKQLSQFCKQINFKARILQALLSQIDFKNNFFCKMKTSEWVLRPTFAGQKIVFFFTIFAVVPFFAIHSNTGLNPNPSLAPSFFLKRVIQTFPISN